MALPEVVTFSNWLLLSLRLLKFRNDIEKCGAVFLIYIYTYTYIYIYKHT